MVYTVVRKTVDVAPLFADARRRLYDSAERGQATPILQQEGLPTVHCSGMRLLHAEPIRPERSLFSHAYARLRPQATSSIVYPLQSQCDEARAPKA